MTGRPPVPAPPPHRPEPERDRPPCLVVCATQGERVALTSPSGDDVPAMLHAAGIPVVHARDPFTVVHPGDLSDARAAAERAGWRVVESHARRRQELVRLRDAARSEVLRGDAAATEGARRYARAASRREPDRREN